MLTKQESDITRDDLADLDDTDDAVCYPAFDQALDIYALSLIYHSRLKKTERSVHYLSVFQGDGSYSFARGSRGTRDNRELVKTSNQGLIKRLYKSMVAKPKLYSGSQLGEV